MRRSIEQPTTVTDGDRTTTTHPAFGMIGASRFSGRAVMYGSDFIHHAGMTIRIRRSEMARDVSHDWFHGRDELIEVRLSEAQWATFVSSPNIGDGVPCTIDSINRAPMPGLPDPVDRSRQFTGELDGKLGDCLDEIKKVIGELDGMGLPKGKAATIRALMEKLLRELTANMPFVAESFGRHVESTVEKAKQEIHGYMLGVITRAGLGALQKHDLPLQLEAASADKLAAAP